MNKVIQKQLKQNIQDYRLGSVFFDLPYYNLLLLTGINYILKKPLQFNSFGTQLHLRSPAHLCLELLKLSKTAPECAFCCGALTHLAVDTIFHKEIENRVNLHTTINEEKHSVHKSIEDEVDLHCHYQLLGHSGVGTKYIGEMLFLKPSFAWQNLSVKAVTKIHIKSPSSITFLKWLRGLRLFGFLSSNKYAPWIKTLPEDNPELLECSMRLAEEAIKLSTVFVNAGFDFFNNKITENQFLKLVPNKSMLNGDAALPFFCL